MSDIINLLPDSVANQIAAGEVIQRPASVVKELVENSIDAGATEITVNIKDAGKTLIQIIDNGKGMSETDARMSFERHATSKISAAEDLFTINTMGFRGEALASIAAIADVELKTKTHDEDLGTFIHIKGSEIQTQETISCPSGTNFAVKNIFFNIPARRKFLKKNSTEFNYIMSEFQKVALANPEIALTLIHNDKITYKLRKVALKQRISDMFGKSMNANLISVKSETSMLNIYGFIGKPEIAKKTRKEQYFFVNKRFMKHPYFYKAVLSAYDQIIAKNFHPAFFMFFEIDPDRIDINIHPQKTEINFEDSQGIFQIIRATVREALGKFNIVPSIDFDREGAVDMPYTSPNTDFSSINTDFSADFNTDFNPFDEEKKQQPKSYGTGYKKKELPDNWETLYTGFETQNDFIQDDATQTEFSEGQSNVHQKTFQLKDKYIVTSVKSGLMIIHQRRAQEQIMFEKFMNLPDDAKIPIQKSLYPTTIKLNPENFYLIREFVKNLHEIGFEISVESDDTVIVSGTPSHFIDIPHKKIVEDIIENLRNDAEGIKQNAKERLAEIASKTYSTIYNKKLAVEEMLTIIDNLFACSQTAYTQSGKKIISKIDNAYIENLFK